MHKHNWQRYLPQNVLFVFERGTFSTLKQSLSLKIKNYYKGGFERL